MIWSRISRAGYECLLLHRALSEHCVRQTLAAWSSMDGVVVVLWHASVHARATSRGTKYIRCRCRCRVPVHIFGVQGDQVSWTLN